MSRAISERARNWRIKVVVTLVFSNLSTMKLSKFPTIPTTLKSPIIIVSNIKVNITWPMYWSLIKSTGCIEIISVLFKQYSIISTISGEFAFRILFLLISSAPVEDCCRISKSVWLFSIRSKSSSISRELLYKLTIEEFSITKEIRSNLVKK